MTSPNQRNGSATESLPFLSSQERLNAYQLITNGCAHVWSKNKIQWDRAIFSLESLVGLTTSDPYFLAHLTSYVFTKSKSKDLQVFTAYAAALSSADGMPFSPGSKYKKPNLRYVGAAAVHMLPPKLAARVLELANTKYGIKGVLNESRHFPTTLRTAFEKYLLYREANPEILSGIKKSGLGHVIANMYRVLHMAPSDEAAAILRWQQKDHHVDLNERPFDFTDKDDVAIAQTIRDQKIPYIGALGELSRVGKKVSPVIAVALLEQATGNQAVIMRKTFEDAGILDDAEVKDLFTQKIGEAKTALDRVEAVTKDASEAVKKLMVEARSEQRKEDMAGVGKVFVHLDFSGSMSHIKQFAAERGAILAELVNDPINNFGWGWFSDRGHRLELPDEFIKDAFSARLFAEGDGGGTDCFALYGEARKFGADVDVLITDQGQTYGDIGERIKRYHAAHPEAAKPRACVIINYGGSYNHDVKDGYQANEIPVVEISPNTVTQSALVTEAIKTAMLGPVATIDEIMATPLLQLPNYYYSL